MVIDEAAGHAVVVGTSIRALDDRPDGTLDLDEIEDAFRDPTDAHEPITGLIAIENTHAHSMGQPLTPGVHARPSPRSPAGAASPLHVDGARFWNAVVAQRDAGVPATDLAGPADTVTFCLSKGLACPVGIDGRRAEGRDLARAPRPQDGRRRDAPGGDPRRGRPGRPRATARTGMIDRLAEDHANARRLAEALSEMDGIVSAGGTAQPAPGPLDPGRVRTNFVLFKVARDRAAFLAALRARGVLMVEYPARPGPRGDALRRGRGRHRDHHRRDARRARRDRARSSVAARRRWPRPA